MKHFVTILVIVILIGLTVFATKKLSAQPAPPNKVIIPALSVPAIRTLVIKAQKIQLDLAEANADGQDVFEKAAIDAGLDPTRYQLFIDPKDGKYYFDPKPDAGKK